VEFLENTGSILKLFRKGHSSTLFAVVVIANFVYMVHLHMCFRHESPGPADLPGGQAEEQEEKL
jgi:hypothetical protein